MHNACNIIAIICNIFCSSFMTGLTFHTHAVNTESKHNSSWYESTKQRHTKLVVVASRLTRWEHFDNARACLNLHMGGEMVEVSP